MSSICSTYIILVYFTKDLKGKTELLFLQMWTDAEIERTAVCLRPTNEFPGVMLWTGG